MPATKRSCTPLFVLYLASVLYVLASGRPSVAQAPSLEIGFPTHGLDVRWNSPFYVAADQEIYVFGGVGGIADPADWAVLVQGRVAPLTPVGSDFAFIHTVALGPAPPTWSGGTWPSWYPYLPIFRNPYRILPPIVVELWHVPSDRVFARRRVVLFDIRDHDQLETKRTLPGIGQGDGLGFQLTDQGLDWLEDAHLSSLPYPSRGQFDAELTARFVGHSEEVATPVGFLAQAKTCFDLDTEADLFEGTEAYSRAIGAAGAAFLAYRTAKLLADISPTPLDDGLPESTFCVQSLPVAPADFEVCVGTVEGEARELTLDSVDAVDLAFGLYPEGVLEEIPGQLVTDPVDVSGLHGTIDGSLRDVFIRWKQGPFSCVDRPRVDIEEDELLSDPALQSWSSCPGLRADADRAMTLFGEIRYGFEPAPVADERLLVRRTQRADFQLADTSTDPDVGTCGRAFIDHHVEDLLDRFLTPMSLALSDAWDETPMQEAVVLDRLLSRFEHGEYEPAEYEVTSSFHELSSFADFDNDGAREVWGMFGTFDTDSEIRPGLAVAPQRDEWVYPPHEPFPWSRTGLSFSGQPFDLSFATTTGALNQVLREFAASERLVFDLEPTCGELGLVGAPYCPTGDAIPPLSGEVLGDFHAPFTALEDARVRLSMRPTLMPFTWMHPDPPPIQPGQPTPEYGRGPLTYQMGQYVVELIEVHPNPDRLWLRALVDFADLDLQIDLDEQVGSRVLTAQLASPSWGLTITETAFRDCPMVPVANYPRYAGACSRQMAGALLSLIAPRLEENLIAMLSDYPAPQFFDADGYAARPVHVSQQDRVHVGQNIVLYARKPE